MKYILLSVFLIWNTVVAFSQIDTLALTLSEVIALAQSDAPDVLIAKTRMTNRYWRYQSFLADYKPQLSLEATLPNLNRSIIPVVQPNGSIAFRQQAVMTNALELRLQQRITSTGGTIFASTGLERLDVFAISGSNDETTYLNNPISINFIQPLFAFNSLKWDKKIEPIRYQQASLEYAEEMEQVAFDAAQLFFLVFTQQLNVEAALRQKANADTLFEISTGRYGVGRIAETDLLQIELRARNANAVLARAQLNLQSSTEQLRNFLGLEQQVAFNLAPPTDIPTYLIDGALAMEYAKQNRSRILELNLQVLDAEREVAEANAESSPNINLFTSFGLSQQAMNFSDAYQDLIDREVVNLGIQLPIADWGKAKARREIARSNSELISMIANRDRIAFEREIQLKVQQFDLVRDQVDLAQQSYEVAQKRQDITQQRYLIGKISLTDLNIAIDEREAARQAYLIALRDFWLAHYELRTLLLYDFERQVSLVRAIDFEN